MKLIRNHLHIQNLKASSFVNWQRQKARHMSTSGHYKSYDKFRLFLIPFSGWTFYGLLIALLILQFDWRILVIFVWRRFAAETSDFVEKYFTPPGKRFVLDLSFARAGSSIVTTAILYI